MRPFPLYAKILLWFFLNLLLLGVLFWVLFGAQFRLRPEWLLSGGAEARIESLTDVILSELNERPRSDWDAILQRFNRAYPLQFFVFREDGGQMAGSVVQLPPPVLARLREPRRPGRWAGMGLRDESGRGFRQREGPGRETGLAPDWPRQGPLRRQGPPWLDGPAEEGPPGLFQPAIPRPKFVVRTSSPTRYWLLVRAALDEAPPARRTPATLVIASGSLSGGGLFFDMRPWLGAALGAVALSALFWLPLVRSITRALAQMTEATRQIAQGRFDVRVHERRRDELGSLGQSINQMAERLAGFVTGQKRFLGDIAHELCSPLAKMRLALDILEQRADEGQKPYIGSASEKAAHMASLVNELLSFSKAALGASSLKLGPVSLCEAAEKARKREAAEGVTVEVEVPEDLVVEAETELLQRALANLLRNAIRYAGQAGPITLSALREGNEAVVTVADRGPGVPEAELARIFDPFYRLDYSRDRTTGGVGLGLAIVKTCIESCGGTVACRNRQPSGLEVSVRLRMARPTPA